MSILPIIVIISNIDIINFVHMLVSNHRVYYLNSDMINEYSNSNSSNKYRKTLTLNSFDEDYNYISLLHAVIPNSFPTIQQEVNDLFIFVFTIGWRKNILDDQPLRSSIRTEVKIEEGFYDETQILKLINQHISNLNYNDFGIQSYADEPDEIVSIVQGREDLFQLDSIDENQTNHIQAINKMNVIYAKSEPVYWIEKLEIVTKDLSYKILGIPKNNYYVCFQNYKPIDLPDSNIESIVSSAFPFTHLPYRPTLAWVSSISIRLDIVNIIEDSNVLENIPVLDPDSIYITYQNNDILNTSKKCNTTFTNGQINIQITQQNGYELNLDNIEFTLDIVVFKK